MNYKLIMLPNPILCSDEEIEKGDWFYYYSHGKFNMYMCEGVVGKSLVIQNKESSCWSDYSKKVIANIEGLPKLDISAIAEEIGWVDVEKLAEHAFEERFNRKPVMLGSVEADSAWLNNWVSCFKTFQSLNEKRFSKDDLKFAMFQVFKNGCRSAKEGREGFGDLHSRVLSHLSKPKEYNVEVEMEMFNTRQSTDYTPYEKGSLIPIIKITNNTIKVTKIINQI